MLDANAASTQQDRDIILSILLGIIFGVCVGFSIIIPIHYTPVPVTALPVILLTNLLILLIAGAMYFSRLLQDFLLFFNSSIQMFFVTNAILHGFIVTGLITFAFVIVENSIFGDTEMITRHFGSQSYRCILRNIGLIILSAFVEVIVL